MRLSLRFLLLAAWFVVGAAHGAQCDPSPVPARGFVAAAERNAPAVVQVVVLRGARDPMEEVAGFEFFQPMQGLPLPGGEGLDRTFSSGFFIDPDGLLLASAHAVFDARGIWIVTADGRHLRAKVLGIDRRRAVALLKVDATAMPVERLAGEPAICSGAWVVAMGSPFGFDRTVTAGIVSTYPRYLHGSDIPLIQSDVVLNPGSSGGPLFDADGALIGMNTMIFSSTGIYVGMSFALPLQELRRTAQVLRRAGASRAGDIGARMQPLSDGLARAFGLDGTAGALIVRVGEGGAAARAGLRAGDVVLGFTRGERLPHEEIESRLSAAVPGTSLAMEVWRGGAPRTVRVEVPAGNTNNQQTQEDVLAGETRLGRGLAVLKARADLPAGLYVESATGSSLLAGVERGDRIVAVNAQPVATVDQFDAALATASGRTVVALLVSRGGAIAYVPVTRGR